MLQPNDDAWYSAARARKNPRASRNADYTAGFPASCGARCDQPLPCGLRAAGCGKTESYRYKLTLAVNTPEGVKHSSGVVELVFYEVSIPARGIMHKLRGEALYLDLGPGAKPLIALLTSQLHPKYGKEQRWTRDAGPDDNLLYGLYGPPPPQSKNYFDDLPRIARMLDNAGSPLLTCPTS
jgi:hypothetical protein